MSAQENDSPRFPAATFVEAMRGLALKATLDVWTSAPPEVVASLYVARAPVLTAPPAEEMERELEALADGYDSRSNSCKFFLSGQVGAGKSMEVLRLVRSPTVQQRFHAVVASVEKDAVVLQHGNIRSYLVLVARALAASIHKATIDTGRDVDDIAGPELRRWVELFVGANWPVAPASNATQLAAMIAGMPSFVDRLHDARAREGFLRDDRYNTDHLLKLVGELGGLLGTIVRRPLLLVMDDGDKINDRDAIRDVFSSELRALFSLPFSALFTFPFWFVFSADYNDLARSGSSWTLRNVRVVDHARPDVTLPEAEDFFRALLARRIADTSWLEDEALRRAIRLSAGIPREFVRIVQAAFKVAGRAPVGLAHLARAAQTIRQEMHRSTVDETVSIAMMLVHLTKLPESDEARDLLRNLLAVELANDWHWYDVHPLLREVVEQKLRDERLRLGVQDTPDGNERLIAHLKERQARVRQGRATERKPREPSGTA